MSDEAVVQVKPCVITREFAAPKQLVFEAFTKPEHLKNWNIPMKGVACDYVSVDIKTGGSTLHKMTMPNGHEMWLLTKYEEVTEPDRVVFRQYMSNEAGDILENEMMPDWPKEMQASISFEEVDGKTKMEFVWQPIDPTQKEADCFAAAGQQAEKGWAGALDILREYLGTL